MSAPTLTMPRRGLADPAWRYRRACDTDIAATFAAERARLAASATSANTLPACETAIAELCDEYDMPLDMPLDVPLPLPRARSGFTAPRAAPQRMAGHIDTDQAVALIALGLLAAAARFGGLFS